MRTALVLAFLAATSAAARTPDGLADAQAARALLGPDVWARVVRIDNAGERGLERRSGYARDVYGLVFELSGILWFYCDTDGTQSLSLRRGTLAADKADPGPLFRALSGRFGAWAWVDVQPGSFRRGPLPNGCLVECLGLLARRIAAGGDVASPRLLSYYVDTPSGPLGHTVLLFADRGGLAVVEPDRPDRVVRVPASESADARSISRFVRGGNVSAARILGLDDFARPRRPARWASLGGASGPAS